MDAWLRAVIANASSPRERATVAFEAHAAGTSAAQTAQVEARLQAWQHAAARGDVEGFAVRLGWDGLDLAGARHVLGPVRMRDDAALPSWAQVLRAVVGESREHDRDDRSLDAAEPIPFEEVLLPFVRWARDACARSAGSAHVLLAMQAHAALERELLIALAGQAARALWLELRIALDEEMSALDRLLRADGSRRGYDAFVAQLRGSGLGAFFTEYSALARVLSVTAELWVAATVELLQRLARDAGAIQAFLQLNGPPHVTAIEPGLSDLHHGARSVAVLTFAGGARLVYKPRGLAIDAGFWLLLDWLRARGAPCELRAARVLDRGEYGWVEHVAHAPCADDAAIARYFERAGALLCLVHVLRGTDCHAGNLIFAGEQPVLIDVETLFTPETPESPLGAGAVRRARKRLTSSVLATYLLPLWSSSAGQGAEQDAVFDGSGLGAELDPARSQSGARWLHVNSDRMQLARVPLAADPLAHAVSVTGHALLVHEHEAELVAGFAAMYRFLSDVRGELRGAASPLHALAHAQVRFVHRNTSVYSALLSRLRQPELLRDGVERALELEQLALAALIGAKYDARAGWDLLFAVEREALERGDVPHFSLRADETSLTIAHGQRLDHWFARSGIDAVRHGLEQLDARDLSFQSDLIRSSLRARAGDARARPEPPDHASHASAAAKTAHDPWLAQALAIGETLLHSAIRGDDGSATWLQPAWSRQKVIGSPKRELMVVGLDLYDGALGIALFLAALFRASQRAELRALSLAALVPLRIDLEQAGEQTADELGIGGLSGLGGVIYGVVQLKRLLDEPALLPTAELAARRLSSARIDADLALDVTTGAAGALLGLLALHEDGGGHGGVNGSDALALAVRCGERVLGQLEPTTGDACNVRTLGGLQLSGFSHGASGIAYALDRLHAVSPDPRWLEAARALIAFERESYSPEHRDWPDLRATDPLCFARSFCHGAPGIALARIGRNAPAQDAADRDELDRALELCASGELSELDSLCCGSFGLVEILATAGHALARPQLNQRARHLAHAALARANARGGYAFELATVGELGCRGLFQGSAGVGYTLLRLLDPSLPQPLLLR